MAEVTGDIGGQSVELNNAATEATLKQLLQATLAMAQKMGADVKKQTDMEKEMKKFFDQLDKTNKGLKDSKKQREDEAKAAAKLAAAKQRELELAQKAEMVTVGLYKGLDFAANQAMAFANKLTGVMSSFANMGSSMSGAASTFNAIPIVGPMLANVFGAVASSAEKLQGAFRSSASVGATFGGSIREMVKGASAAGLTFDQFSNVIKNNSEDLVRLGGSTTAGAKRLGDLSATLKKTGLQDDLARLGYTSEDIAAGMAKSVGTLYAGIKQTTIDKGEQAKVGAEYLKNLTAISAATGKNREEMEKETQRRANDARVKAAYAGLDAKSRSQMEGLFNAVPAELQKAVEEIALTGTAQSDEAQMLMALHGDVARHALEINQKIRRRDVITQEDRLAFDKTMMKEGQKTQEALRNQTGATAVTMTYVGGAAAQVGLGFAKVGERSETVADAQQQQTQDLKAASEAANKHKDSLDPANMLRMQQEIAKTSNEFNVLLATHLPKLQEAFTTLADFVKTYVVPIFEFFMNHIKEITIAIAAVIVGLTVLSKTMQALKAYQDFKALGKERGSTPANPMFTKDVGGGAGGGPDVDVDKGKEKGKPTGKGKGIGRLVKGAGVVGAVAGAGMLYSDISDINEREKAGEITAHEATIEKSGAVGSAAGGAGGAMAGAAAGAAIGSVVPVIGTVVGGAIGAALGGWLGSKGGEVAGEELAKAVAKPGAGSPEWMKINEKNIQSWVDAVAKGSQKFEAVPDVYKPYVQERLNKLPKATTATPAATPTAPKPQASGGGGAPAATAKPEDKTSGIDYNARPEDLLRQFAKAQGVIKPGDVPSVATATGSIVTEAEKKAAAEAKAKKDAEDKAKEEQKGREATPPAGQENPGTMLASLNTTMGQLLKTNRELLAISEKQLAVQRGITGDIFTV